MQADFSNPTPRAAGVTPQGTAWSRYGQGTPVVLLHGVGMDRRVWTPQINDLAQDFDVLVFDMWGHGQSVLPNSQSGPLELGDYARQLLDLMDQQDISQAHVVGHSMGALVALEFALDHPERCLSVVAMNAVFSRSESQSQMVQRRAQELSLHGTQANLDDTMARWFGCPVAPDAVQAEKLSRRLLEEVNPRGYASAYQVFATADAQHAPRLHGLLPHTRFFTGELDPNSTPAMSQAMAELAPNAEVIVLPGQRHMMSLTAPMQVNQVLREAFNPLTEQLP
ncbi:MAG: alpha/beta hydrolase [Pseudomonadota bacterium]